MYKSLQTVFIILFMSMSISACSTMTSAYDSVTDTVGGWFKSDEAKK